MDHYPIQPCLQELHQDGPKFQKFHHQFQYQYVQHVHQHPALQSHHVDQFLTLHLKLGDWLRHREQTQQRYYHLELKGWHITFLYHQSFDLLFLKLPL